MSQKVDLLQKLEIWKNHNEVHAHPADKKLYELLKEIIQLLDGQEAQPPAPPQTPPPVMAADDEGPGQNHLEDPSGNP